MAILAFDRFEVTKNLIFHNSSRKSQMPSFVLVTLKTALPAKVERNAPILDFNGFDVSKNPLFHNSFRRSQMLRFVLATLRAA